MPVFSSLKVCPVPGAKSWTSMLLLKPWNWAVAKGGAEGEEEEWRTTLG